MNLNALLKGGSSSGSGCRVPGGKPGSPRSAPAIVSPAGKAPAAIMRSVADDPESDVEEDPFAEFTVMDGLEDLDEMLNDKYGEGSHANLSHGHELSESLATGMAASVQPAFSDVLQSDEQPGTADEATQRSPVKHGENSTQAAADEVYARLHAEPCDSALPNGPPDQTPEVQPNAIICESNSAEPPAAAKPLFEADPGSGALQVLPASLPKMHTWPVPTSSNADSALEYLPASVNTSQPVPVDAANLDDVATVQKQLPPQAILGEPAGRIASPQTSSPSQAPQGNSAAIQPAMAPVLERDTPTGTVSESQPRAPAVCHVAPAGRQTPALDGTMQPHPITTEGHPLGQDAGHDVDMEPSPRICKLPPPVPSNSSEVPLANDVDMQDSWALQSPQRETPCQHANAEGVAGQAGFEAAQLTEAPRSQPLCPINASSTDNAGDHEIAAAHSDECGSQAEVVHTPTEREGGDGVDDSTVDIVDQHEQGHDQEMHDGEPMQHPVRLQAEGIRDVPVSTATSVDSRAALLSSFWDTMSTDHAPEADDGSDVLAPAHASQCASGPSWDAPHHSVTVHPGRQSPPMAPTYNMSICCDNIKHAESETPGSLGKSPTVSSTPEVEHGHQHETRPSLQLRMASLSPTLAASPGLHPGAPSATSDAANAEAPATLMLDQNEEQNPDADCTPPITTHTDGMRDACSVPVEAGEHQQTLAESPTAPMPVPATEVQMADVEFCGRAGVQRPDPQALLAPGTEPRTETPDFLARPQPHPTAEASVPSVSIPGSRLIRPDRIPEPLVCVSQSEPNSGNQPSLSSSHVRPPHPPPSVLTRPPHAVEEQLEDAPVLSSSMHLQENTLMAKSQHPSPGIPTVQDATLMRPNIDSDTCTVGRPVVIRHALHTGGAGSDQKTSERAETSVATKKSSIPDCPSANDTSHIGTHSSVLKPINNLLDQSKVHHNTSNGENFNQDQHLLLSDGQHPETVECMVGKRKLAGDRLHEARAKERRIDLPADSEACTDNPSEPVSSVIPQAGKILTASSPDEHVQITAARPESVCDSLHQDQSRAGDMPPGSASTSEGADVATCTQVARASASSSIPAKASSDCAPCSVTVPDYRKALAELSASLHEATINVDETIDQAAEARVQSAVLNNRWASMLQAEMFGSPDKSLSECFQNLESVAVACREAMAVAVSHGWVKAHAGQIDSMSVKGDGTFMEGSARPCQKQSLQEQRALAQCE